MYVPPTPSHPTTSTNSSSDIDASSLPCVSYRRTRHLVTSVGHAAGCQITLMLNHLRQYAKGAFCIEG